MNSESNVYVRGLGKFVSIPIASESDAIVPKPLIDKWQRVLNLIAQVYEVPSSLVMMVKKEEIEVLLKNSTPDNPYENQETADLGCGLYCETVLGTDAELEVVDSLDSPVWKDNPDVKLDMISYYGLPLKWPDKSFFGTICILDSRARRFDQTNKQLFEEFRKIIESDLLIHKQKLEIENENQTIKRLKETAIELSQKATKKQIVNQIAHEMSSPINVNLTTSELLLDSLKNRKHEIKPEGVWEEIHEFADFLNRHNVILSQKILDLKAQTNAELYQNRVSFNVCRHIEGLLLSMRDQLESQEFSYELKAPENVTIYSYPPLFSQVVTSLIENSIRHGSRDSDPLKITIEINAIEHEQLRIRISDNGPGVPVANRNTLFQPYARSSESDGAGLGLSVTHQLVTHALEGSIKLIETGDHGFGIEIVIPIWMEK